MATIRIPTPLRAYTDGQSEVVVQGDTVAGALADLLEQFPSLQTHLCNDQNELRSFVNLFLNDENIKELEDLHTPVNESDRLMLLPSIAGGS
jgi:molybdopterin converting factor small subunit